MNNNFAIIRLSKFTTIEQIQLSLKTYKFLISLILEYPNFSKWYWSLYTTEGKLKENREILICLDQTRIIGIAILKKSYNEKKVCTLRVEKSYQGKGIGSKLLEKSFEILNEEKPLITIHISKYNSFKALFDKYGFSMEQELIGCYGLFKTELCYNGLLEKNNYTNNTSAIIQASYIVEKNIYNYPSTYSSYLIHKKNNYVIQNNKNIIVT